MNIDIAEDVERDIVCIEKHMMCEKKDTYKIYKIATKNVYHKDHWIKKTMHDSLIF
jgi:hypothetical protein